jgi:AraC-like DNA-binding protein
MLARASISSPTLGLALKRWCRHHALITGDIRLELSAGAHEARIELHEVQPLPRALRELSMAYVLRNIHGLACWYVDSRIPLIAAAFPFAAPPHADAYGAMFPGPVEFAAPLASLRFDARYLALPLKRDDRALRQMLQRALPITVFPYKRDRLIVQQVRMILAADPSAAHDAHSIADSLHVSARTLHRQLKDEGASLQQLKDEVRAQHARDLLVRSRKAVKQVAAATGFRSEKAFIRAFGHWTGMTPAQFRDAHG